MSDSRSIIIVGLVSALILCGGAAAVIAFNDTNNNASDVSDAYSSSTADSLFIKSSSYSAIDNSSSSDLFAFEKADCKYQIRNNVAGMEITALALSQPELKQVY